MRRTTPDRFSGAKLHGSDEEDFYGMCAGASEAMALRGTWAHFYGVDYDSDEAAEADMLMCMRRGGLDGEGA